VAPLPTPGDRIGLLDFLALSGCELQINLGRRNSHLGRHASASQRLLLDLEFLRLAPACIAQLGSAEPALAAQLEELTAARKAALPVSIYNALLAGPEWRAFWHPATALGSYPSDTAGDIVDTLGQLEVAITAWLAGDYRADGGLFELQLAELRRGDGGLLLRAAAAQADALTAANQLLALATAGGGLCPFQADTDRSRALRNVATRFFAEGLQPWLAQLRRREALLMAPIQRIEDLLAGHLPPTYQQWQAARDQRLAQLRAAPRAHAEAISDALAPCGGIRPGNA
jgi:hypothetical protein